MSEEAAATQTVDVTFPLTVIDDYPPVRKITVPAHPLGEGRYRICAIPFFVNDLSFNDVISAREGDSGALVFEALLERSPLKTIQVNLKRKDYLRYLVEFLEHRRIAWDVDDKHVHFVMTLESDELYHEVSVFLEVAYERNYLDYVVTRP